MMTEPSDRVLRPPAAVFSAEDLPRLARLVTEVDGVRLAGDGHGESTWPKINTNKY